MPWNNDILDSGILAVHAALVPSGGEGEVVLFGGDEHWSLQQESEPGEKFKNTRVYDVETHTILDADVPSPDSDVFCSHHAFAADGRLLIAGGTSKWPETDIHEHVLAFLGHRRSWLYNARVVAGGRGRAWVEAQRLNTNPDHPDEEESGGRWYPGLVTLGNGDVLALFGHPMQKDNRHRNTLPERYVQQADAWINAPKAMADPHKMPPVQNSDGTVTPGVRHLFFPRAFTLPDGKLFLATPMPVDIDAEEAAGPYFSTRYNPFTGDYEGFEIPEPSSGAYHNWNSPAVLLPLLWEEDYRPRVLFCGGGAAIKIDLGATEPEWAATKPRPESVRALTRTYSNTAILPTGQVCLVGGVNVVDPEEPVLVPEFYDPGIDWSTGTYSDDDRWTAQDEEPAAITRNYHSTALLLPNGKVWVAGGNVNGAPGPDDPDSEEADTFRVRKIELYEPEYIAVTNRIRIIAWPQFVSYEESFDITLDRPAADVERVALIRNSSVTHSTNNDQRYIGLEITERSGNTVTVTAPPTGNVAPPGYYMLWVVDGSGNPCQLAKFVRMAPIDCTAVTDRSTFSEEEVTSLLLDDGGPATIFNAIYVYVDGFIHTEFTGEPDFALTWDDTGETVPREQVTLVREMPLLEVDPGDPDIPQRITFPFHIRFFDTNAFDIDTRKIRLTFTVGIHTCTETIDLVKSPNPYMIDVDPALNNPHWLSTDVRTFTMRGGSPFGDIIQGTGADAPYDFIKAVLDQFNDLENNSAHPFLNLPTEQDSAPLELAPEVSGAPYYNYAVAKVRYRANVTDASNVKVFFRMFNTVGTALEYNTGTTYRLSPGADPVPLLGNAGGEIVSIPFFLSKRVETVQGRPGATSMTEQPLDTTYEIRDIDATPGSEVTVYFGCWLDINQERKLFPIEQAGSDGPWAQASCNSIQELMRGRHQCLVAEVYFKSEPTDPDSTDPGETPGSSDKLSQRNLAIIYSDNPGGPDSHLVMHTLEVKPSSAPTVVRRWRPDELLFRWHNLPQDAEVTLHFSDLDTAEIMQFAALRRSPVAFTPVDKHTVRFPVADATWMPIPAGRKLHIPALLSVRLPDTVVYGQTFRISVHQVNGITQKVIGAFELTVPVSSRELIIEDEVRTLSVMKHIATTIPPDSRWYPIFRRYLVGLGSKVDALGGDADAVHPNPDGSGRPYRRPEERPPDKRCFVGWGSSLLLGVTLVLLGFLGLTLAGALALVVGAVVLTLLIASWSRTCHGRIRCAVIDHLLLGSSAAVGVLGIALAADVATTSLRWMLVIAAIITAMLAVGSFVLRCSGRCCDKGIEAVRCS